ncbi:MAG: hypothetical protein ACREO0_12940 [Pseudoxanthomonas sp.]
MDSKKTRKGRGIVGNVIDFSKAKARRARQFVDQGIPMERPLLTAVDEATRDLHAAAHAAMSLARLARSRLGLPDI